MVLISNIEQAVEENEKGYDEGDCVDLVCCCMVSVWI